jgi:hypothetical protein
MLNVFLRNVGARPELLILTLMVMIIAMLIIPLPTVLVDFLIGLNIVISLLVFMGSFYIERILSFSTFPALLLLTTLFRLALSISTSRLILSQADAGEIIASFGEFVIGENLVVGFVIFSIVTIVQGNAHNRNQVGSKAASVALAVRAEPIAAVTATTDMYTKQNPRRVTLSHRWQASSHRDRRAAAIIKPIMIPDTTPSAEFHQEACRQPSYHARSFQSFGA